VSIRFLYIFLLLVLSNQVNATDVMIRITPVHLTSISGESPDYTVKTLRMYLSEISYLKGVDTVWTEPEGYRLLDIGDSSSWQLASFLPDELTFDAIRFRLGVDSISSSTGAHTGALDPAYGMYWAWHTGYVNLKIEGTCSACPSPKNEFELHIGGFQTPYDAERNVTLDVTDTNLEILFDVGAILSYALSQKHFRVMTPSENAMRIADVAAKSFSIKK
jgi:hypothetical protein